MTNDNQQRSGAATSSAPDLDDPGKMPARVLTPAAQRALAEADERRRAAREAATSNRPRELHGRGGAEPVRFGDWEIKGLAVDF